MLHGKWQHKGTTHGWQRPMSNRLTGMSLSTHKIGGYWECCKFFIDTTMAFGLHSAPKLFTALADAVEWVLRERGIQFVIHYLYDFLLVGSTDYAACVAHVLDTFEELGLPVALNKLEGPTSCLTFLGFELDAVAMELRLSQSKLEELQREFNTGNTRTCALSLTWSH